MGGVTGSAGPDMAYIAELYEQMSRFPPGIAYRKLLIEHYMSVGDPWLEGALDEAKKLKDLVPGDSDIDEYLTVLSSTPDTLPVEKNSPSEVNQNDHFLKETSSKPGTQVQTLPLTEKTGKLDDKKMGLASAYKSVAARAKLRLSKLLRLPKSTPKDLEPPPSNITTTQVIEDETNVTIVSRIKTTQIPDCVARNIKTTPKNGTKIAIEDMETIFHILQPHESLDAIRDLLIQRLSLIKPLLPQSLQVHCTTAFMHIEHERLARNYVNDETMLGDKVTEIPRTEFFVTEDNYAWSMDELVQAIRANSGVFRNPLSREMFTPEDVRGILAHPLGAPLAALRVEQAALCKGVRVQTIEAMERLAKALLADQSSDAIASRTAVDEFLLHVATLPQFEQKALEGLKCPARDSHTGQAYDCSVGKAVQDAKGNLVCFHKTGDFIRQAARYLRKTRGSATGGQ